MENACRLIHFMSRDNTVVDRDLVLLGSSVWGSLQGCCMLIKLLGLRVHEYFLVAVCVTERKRCVYDAQADGIICGFDCMRKI